MQGRTRTKISIFISLHRIGHSFAIALATTDGEVYFVAIKSRIGTELNAITPIHAGIARGYSDLISSHQVCSSSCQMYSTKRNLSNHLVDLIDLNIGQLEQRDRVLAVELHNIVRI